MSIPHQSVSGEVIVVDGKVATSVIPYSHETDCVNYDHSCVGNYYTTLISNMNGISETTLHTVYNIVRCRASWASETTYKLTFVAHAH